MWKISLKEEYKGYFELIIMNLFFISLSYRDTVPKTNIFLRPKAAIVFTADSTRNFQYESNDEQFSNRPQEDVHRYDTNKDEHSTFDDTETFQYPFQYIRQYL